MAEESDLEKTESPSPRRLEQAREEGRAPHSRELATFSVLFASIVGLAIVGESLGSALRRDLKAGLTFDHSLVLHPEWMTERLGEVSMSTLSALLPWLGGIFLFGSLIPLTMSGFLFSTKNFMPDFSRLSPARGLGNILSVSGLVELFKAILKATLIGGLATWFLWSSEGTALGLANLDVGQGVATGMDLLRRCMYVLLAGLAVVVAIDVPFQLWRHNDSLKMTREELKQEAKETDGDPHVKARIRQQQRAASKRRMMSEVPKADFVVTNPTHYAVALKYDPASMRAPRVIAKGGDLIALNIRELAEKHSIPILEQPPLARSLYKHTQLEQEIPPALYSAVAEVLAYIFQLRAFEQGSGAYPNQPRTVDVPAELAVPATPGLMDEDSEPLNTSASGRQQTQASAITAISGIENGGVLSV
jgi:flagellar biosynthetic protein FlhB